MERFLRCIHKMRCYLFSERFRGCRKTLFMPQITSVVSKVVESVDCCQPVMSFPDNHTKSSLPTLKTPLMSFPALAVSYSLHLWKSLVKTRSITHSSSEILDITDPALHLALSLIRNPSNTDTLSAKVKNIPLAICQTTSIRFFFSFLSWRSTKLTLNYACLQ